MNGVVDWDFNMTAVPLSQGAEPQLHSLVDQSSMSGRNDHELTKNDSNFMELGSICGSDAVADLMSVKPTTFITGPEVWPSHLQLKVKTCYVCDVEVAFFTRT